MANSFGLVPFRDVPNTSKPPSFTNASQMAPPCLPVASVTNTFFFTMVVFVCGYIFGLFSKDNKMIGSSHTHAHAALVRSTYEFKSN